MTLFQHALRPFTSQVPLGALIIALYHDAPWNSRISVSIEQFTQDFHFTDITEVEYLFLIESSDPGFRDLFQKRLEELDRLKIQPFQMRAPRPIRLSLIEKRVRSQAFRQNVRAAYNYSCAVCGLKVQFGNKWEVEAAHIYPSSMGGTDDVRNGIALCRTHHWAFDQHQFKIERNFTITWRPTVPSQWSQYTSLHLPNNSADYPNQDHALEWHRNHFDQ